ncbi:MAG: class I SAM-dependent methyltransferase [Halapricum sp.]
MFRQSIRKTSRRFDNVWGVKPLDDLCYRRSIARWHRLSDDEHDLSGVLDTAYRFAGIGRYRTISPLQLRSELTRAVEHLRDREPEVVVEIGSLYGGTFYTWCRGIESVERAISLDLPGGTPPRFLDRITPDTDTSFVRGNSHAQAARDAVEDLLDGDQIDFLFVDGDHSYEGLRRDLELFTPLVGDDGVIGLHDIETVDPAVEVDALWQELRDDHETVGIVDTRYDPADPISIAGHRVTGHGIGFFEP